MMTTGVFSGAASAVWGRIINRKVRENPVVVKVMSMRIA